MYKKNSKDSMKIYVMVDVGEFGRAHMSEYCVLDSYKELDGLFPRDVFKEGDRVTIQFGEDFFTEVKETNSTK